MLTRQQKQERVQELKETLSGAKSLFIVENRGLTVNQVNELRSRIRAVNAQYHVYKNAVVRFAVKGTPMEDLTEDLAGPNAFAYTAEDPVELAKILKEFVKKHGRLSFKRAFIDGAIVTAEEAEQIADLPSKDELIAKLLYMLQSPIRRLVVALNSPLQGLANALDQIVDTKEES